MALPFPTHRLRCMLRGVASVLALSVFITMAIVAEDRSDLLSGDAGRGSRVTRMSPRGGGTSSPQHPSRSKQPRVRLLQNLTPMRTFVGPRSRESGNGRPGRRQPMNSETKRSKPRFMRDALSIFDVKEIRTLGDYQEEIEDSHPVHSMTPSDLDIQFLGTASCMPSGTRSVSCTAVRKDGEIWLFDVGEGSQMQIQKCSNLRTSKVSKIFITHLHGDHCFGLAGLMCLMGAQTDEDKKRNQVVEIFGPKGLRAYLRASLRMTYSRVVPPYVVHELWDIPYTHGEHDTQALPPFAGEMEGLPRHQRYGEIGGGRDIFPDKEGVWRLFGSDPATGMTVTAAPVRHTVPTVGFCLSEPKQPGTLNFNFVGPIVQRNMEGLKLPPFNMADPKKIFRNIKNMRPRDSLTFPDGTVLSGEDAVFPEVNGRKIVILGDTCDPSGPMDALAKDCDVLIHEATNAFIREFDSPKSPSDVASETFDHGHSTPANAGAYARKLNARRLVLYHFSSRYRGDASRSSRAIMRLMEHQAAIAMAGVGGGRGAGRGYKEGEEEEEEEEEEEDLYAPLEGPAVIAAWDLMHLPVSRRKHKGDPEFTSGSNSQNAGGRRKPRAAAAAAAAAVAIGRLVRTSKATMEGGGGDQMEVENSLSMQDAERNKAESGGQQQQRHPHAPPPSSLKDANPGREEEGGAEEENVRRRRRKRRRRRSVEGGDGHDGDSYNDSKLSSSSSSSSTACDEGIDKVPSVVEAHTKAKAAWEGAEKEEDHDDTRKLLLKLKIPELKERLAGHGLPKSGNKADLVARLADFESGGHAATAMDE